MRNWVLALVTTAIALIAVEALSFALYPIEYMRPVAPLPSDTWRELLHQQSSIPGLAYELTPHKYGHAVGSTIATNGFGMRDSEPLEETNDSVCNIVVLGDSYTFGFGVYGDNTYTNVLERLLATDFTNMRIQALNLGVGGYSSKDEALVLRHKGMQWNPRLVIIGYVLNDPEIKPVQPLHRYYQEPKWWQHVNTFRLIASSMRGWKINNDGDGDYYRYLHALHGESWNSVLHAFSDIQAIAEKNGIPVLLVVFPYSFGEEWSSYPYRDLHSQVVDAGRESGFFTVDLYDAYAKHTPNELMVAPGDGHPNYFGHRLAAESIHEAIEQFNLLQCM